MASGLIIVAFFLLYFLLPAFNLRNRCGQVKSISKSYLKRKSWRQITMTSQKKKKRRNEQTFSLVWKPVSKAGLLVGFFKVASNVQKKCVLTWTWKQDGTVVHQTSGIKRGFEEWKFKWDQSEIHTNEDHGWSSFNSWHFMSSFISSPHLKGFERSPGFTCQC